MEYLQAKVLIKTSGKFEDRKFSFNFFFWNDDAMQ